MLWLSTNDSEFCRRPYVTVHESMLKLHIEPSDDITFPAYWKDIMKMDAQSPELNSSSHLFGVNFTPVRVRFVHG